MVEVAETKTYAEHGEKLRVRCQARGADRACEHWQQGRPDANVRGGLCGGAMGGAIARVGRVSHGRNATRENGHAQLSCTCYEDASITAWP